MAKIQKNNNFIQIKAHYLPNMSLIIMKWRPVGYLGKVISIMQKKNCQILENFEKKINCTYFN